MAHVYILGLLLGVACLGPVYAEMPRFIDTQAQFDPLDFDYRGSLEIMLKENQAAFERLLSHNRKARIN